MSRRGELLGAAFWAGLGTAIAIASWRMDRLGHQGISPWSAPGLTPGIVGALMVVFALALAWQARGLPRQGEPADAAAAAADARATWRRSAGATLLCVLFAGISLGHGLPFQVEAAAFILAFTAVFRWRQWKAEGRVARRLAQTLAVAAAAALAIGWLFESVFLVRLP
ncbi:MAG: tripartite tricarboxylate transporter TctB family protein [Rubrivivax sp.]|nr:tripartite tricarboxylate transporter TctB family protein [Rubrivivax sp.]